MSDTLLILPAEGGGWDLVADTATIAHTDDRDTAERVCRLIEADETRLPSRPDGLPSVQCFEAGDGTVEIVVGVRSLLRCVDWSWAVRIARLLEADEYSKLPRWMRAQHRVTAEPRNEARLSCVQGGA